MAPEMIDEVETTQEDILELLGEGVSQDILDDYAVVDESKDDESEAVVADGEAEEGVKTETDPGKEVAGDVEDDTGKTATGVKKSEEVDDEQEADIASKSGNYTIPYEKLTAARDGEAAAKIATRDALSEIERLKGELVKANSPEEGLKTDEETGEDALSEEELSDLDAEFPGLSKSIMSLRSQVQALEQKNERLSQDSVKQEGVDHFNAIENAHEHSQEMLTSVEFGKFVDSSSPILKNEYTRIYNNGTSREVIEMLNDFLATKPEARTVEEDQRGKDDIEEKKGKAETAEEVAKKIKAAKEKVTLPGSLSEIPGSESPTDPAETLQTSGNSGKAIDAMFAGKSQDQVNAMVNKLLK